MPGEDAGIVGRRAGLGEGKETEKMEDEMMLVVVVEVVEEERCGC